MNKNLTRIKNAIKTHVPEIIIGASTLALVAYASYTLKTGVRPVNVLRVTPESLKMLKENGGAILFEVPEIGNFALKSVDY